MMSIKIKLIPHWVSQLASEHGVQLSDVESVMTEQDKMHYINAQGFIHPLFVHHYTASYQDTVRSDMKATSHDVAVNAALGLRGKDASVRSFNIDLLDIATIPDGNVIYLCVKPEPVEGGSFHLRFSKALATLTDETTALTSVFFRRHYLDWKEGNVET